jgi:large subunit ribosomal protein L15
MQLTAHKLKPSRGSKHAPKRVGRGNASGHGNYSTRGGKGQTARSGGSHRLALKAFKRMMQSTPKLRGFNSHRPSVGEVYLSALDKNFADGADVTFAMLKEKKMVRIGDKKAKIVVNGKLTKKLSLVGIACTKTAKEAIEKAGGEVK